MVIAMYKKLLICLTCALFINSIAFAGDTNNSTTVTPQSKQEIIIQGCCNSCKRTVRGFAVGAAIGGGTCGLILFINSILNNW